MADLLEVNFTALTTTSQSYDYESIGVYVVIVEVFRESLSTYDFWR